MKQTKGFTIVELLIVIVVIGILAAITIVAFNGVQDRARTSSSQATVSQFARKVSLWQVDNPNQTPTPQVFATIASDTGANTHYQYQPGENGAFCATITSNEVSYRLTETGAPASGACNGHDANMRAPTTNLVLGPSFETDTAYYSVLGGPGGSASGSRINTGGVHGEGFYRATWAASPTGSGSAYIQNTGTGTATVAAGETYYFRVSARTSWASTLKFTVVWWNSSNQTVSSAPGSDFTQSPNQWNVLSAQLVAPSGAVRARILVENTGSVRPPVGGTLDIDGLMVSPGQGPYAYTDGTSNGWAWSGIPHNSNSSKQ